MADLSPDVKNRILETFRRCVNIPVEKLDEFHWDEPLTGQYYGFSELDLVYLLFELESEFQVRIRPESLENYGFGTISGICKIIQDYL